MPAEAQCRDNSWKGWAWTGPCGSDSPSQSEALHFIDSAKSRSEYFYFLVISLWFMDSATFMIMRLFTDCFLTFLLGKSAATAQRLDLAGDNVVSLLLQPDWTNASETTENKSPLAFEESIRCLMSLFELLDARRSGDCWKFDVSENPTELSTNRKFCFSVNSIASQYTYWTRRRIISQIVYSAHCRLCATCLEQSYSSCCPPCTELSDFGQTWIQCWVVRSFSQLEIHHASSLQPLLCEFTKVIVDIGCQTLSQKERKELELELEIVWCNAGLLDLIRCAFWSHLLNGLVQPGHSTVWSWWCQLLVLLTCETDNAATALPSDRRNTSRAASTRPTATPLVFTFRLRVRTLLLLSFFSIDFLRLRLSCFARNKVMALPRTVLVTGANRGLGLEFVRQFLAGSNPSEHVFATHRAPLGNRIHQGKLYRAYKFVCWMNMWRECEKKKWAQADQAAEVPRSSEMQFTQW